MSLLTTQCPRSTARRALVGAAGLAGLVAAALAVEHAFAEVPTVVAPPENQITEPKRVLGKILFWEEQLSSDNTVACGTCHIPARNGTDPRLGAHPGADGVFSTPDDVIGSPGLVRADATGAFEKDASFGLEPRVTGRSAQPAPMAMYSQELFWDGRASGTFRDPVTDEILIASGGALESQAVGPPLSDIEMAHSGRDWSEITMKLESVVPLVLATNLPSDAAAAIEAHGSYPALFEAAFGDDAITVKRIAFAIATYERTLVADQTPWDRFRAGQTNALTGAALRGWNAFNAPQHACTMCHEPPLFTDDSFRNIGLRPVSEDVGRQGVTGSSADRGKFKVPSLRNAGLKRTFMHNGRLASLDDVLRFYAQGPGVLQFTDNQDPLIGPIRIPPPVQADIVAFLSTGLTDPRVAAEQFPFDRPTLYSERTVQNPVLVDSGIAGSDGRTPRMIAISPPNLGNDLFQLGVDSAVPGATASLVMSMATPVAGVVAQHEVVGTITLDGAAAGDGHGAAIWPVPADPELAGRVLHFQWRVQDAAAAGGVALSRVARVTLVGGVLTTPEEPGEPEEPQPPESVPVVAGDASLYAVKAAFVIDWKAHATAESDDSFTLFARLNPRGATSAAGAVVSLSVNGEALVTTSALSSSGTGSGTAENGARYKVKLDAGTGALAIKVQGLDLRTVTGLSDAAGSGWSVLGVVVRIDGIALESPEVRGDLEFTYKTKSSGSATKGKFAFARQRSLDGAFAVQSARAKRRATGEHAVSIKGSLALEGGLSAHPVGPVVLTIGDARSIEVPLSALRLSARDAEAQFAYDSSALAVEGLKSLKYDGSSRQIKVVTGDLAGLGLPETGALEADVLVRLEIPLESGTVAYESVVRARRRSGAASRWKQ